MTFDLAHQLFEYRDGKLLSKVNRVKVRKGQEVGSINGKGYKQTAVKGKIYAVHRIIYLMQHGYLPQFIDHIDNNPLNNKIENLREVTHQQNCMNTVISTKNSSGFKGVTWNKARQKWIAQLAYKKTPIYLGGYEDIELADLVVQMAREKYHGKYSNHGVKTYGSN